MDPAADQDAATAAEAEPGRRPTGWWDTREAEVNAASEAAAALADRLAAAGHPIDERWREALRAVPREVFIPEIGLACPNDGSTPYVINRTVDPDQWRGAVYSDTAIVTQLDDGATDLTTATGDYSSSASAPGILLDFLALLDVYDGDEVLEIGTGTGWTAALLAARLGDERITTIEVDPAVAGRAEANLKAAGHTPHVVVGDGAYGHPAGGPYDRVHVTCGVTTVPYAWVEQTRPGGQIVFPWMPGHLTGHVTRLTVADDAAIGRFHGLCGYMIMRSQRFTDPPTAEPDRDSATSLDPRRIARASQGADIAIAALLPGLHTVIAEHDDDTFHMWLSDATSSAYVLYSPDYRQSAVHQSGPRDLWDELHDAFLTWIAWGQPTRDRFGLTVTRDRQYVWLDDPDRPIEPRTGRP